MLTAKEIHDVQFHRSMGGYKTNEVDDFLDRCAATVEALTAQNEENKSKMQVLAESIVEYRNQEDSIRFALINAQRMAESVVKEAEEKAAAIIAQAESHSADLLSSAEESAASAREQTLAEIELENSELMRIRQEVSDFKAKLMSIYREHLTLIGVLEEHKPAQPAEEAPAQEKAAAEDADEVAETSVEEPVSVAADSSSSYTGPIPDFSAFELPDTDE